MVCVAKLLTAPPDAVLLIYVKLDQAYIQDVVSPTGVVTHWSLVETDPFDPLQPRDAKKRFSRRLW